MVKLQTLLQVVKNNTIKDSHSFGICITDEAAGVIERNNITATRCVFVCVGETERERQRLRWRGREREEGKERERERKRQRARGRGVGQHHRYPVMGISYANTYKW